MTTRSGAEERLYIHIMNRRWRWTLDMLTKKRIKIRRQLMTALIAIYRGLEGTYVNGFLDATMVPVRKSHHVENRICFNGSVFSSSF